MEKIVLITGGSSGIGLKTSAALNQAGYKVYEISRRDVKHPGIIHMNGSY